MSLYRASWMTILLEILVLAASLPAADTDVTVADDDVAADDTAAAYVREIETWRHERDERLRRDDGWLTLVGLYWLAQGANTCGSHRDNALVFPEAAPERVGTFHVHDLLVTFEAAEGVVTKVDGRPAQRAELVADSQGEPTLLEVGSFKLHLIERGGRLGVRLKDSESAALAAFDGMESFPTDAAWHLEGRFVPYEPPKVLQVPNVLGTPSEQPCPGKIEFEIGTETYALDVLPAGDQFFVVFGDSTNGHETYGGGRFLYTDLPDNDGRVDLDFNKAYNPPCVFTPYATCPLPPPANRLRAAIMAGEKNFAGGVH